MIYSVNRIEIVVADTPAKYRIQDSLLDSEDLHDPPLRISFLMFIFLFFFIVC
jgi:hypothetical protein